jgi:hypothetical protein
VKTVSLPSQIQRARWLQSSGAAGEEAVLEVLTHFVGNGSELEVEVRTKSGQTIEKTRGEMRVNRFQHSFTISEDTKEDISFSASLPKHGLTASSPVLRVFPRRAITNARWDKKEARRGDVVKLLADTEGIPDGTEVDISILEWDQDSAHDPVCALSTYVRESKIELEWEYQYQEDTDDIPSEEELQPVDRHYRHPEYFFKVTLDRCEAESELLLFKDWMELTLAGSDEGMASKLEYELTLPDSTKRTGKLDQNGKAVEKDLPPGVIKVEWKIEGDSGS